MKRFVVEGRLSGYCQSCYTSHHCSPRVGVSWSVSRETSCAERRRSMRQRDHLRSAIIRPSPSSSQTSPCRCWRRVWTRGGLPAVRHFGMDPRGCAGSGPHPAGALRAPQHPSREDLSKAVPHPLPNVTVFQTHWARTWRLCEGQGTALCRLVVLAPSIGQAGRSLH